MTSRIPFKGRAQDLAKLKPLLTQQGITLVLEGPPGVGKSRLMEELQTVYHQTHPTHPQPQWISLVEAYSVEDLLNAITQALHVRAPARWEDHQQQGLDVFDAAQSSLLLFDNCEQLNPDARALLRQWRAARPTMRWCLTSQEALDLPHEMRHSLHPLPCPTAEATLKEIQENPSVQLLHTLVHWRRGQYTPDEQEWHDLSHMARQVDGIPLGLTMAAGRMAILDAQEIQERVEKDVGILRATPGLQDAHHTTMRVVLERTLSRLSPAHQELWVQLSVFYGGFDVEAAEGIITLTHDNTVLNVLEELEHRFLLRSYTDQKKQRLELLQLMLHLARQEAKATGQWNDLKNRHAAWYATQGLQRSLLTINNAQAIPWILRERRNLEAARLHMKNIIESQPIDPKNISHLIWLTITLSIGQRRSSRYSMSSNFLLETLQTARACWDDLSPRWRSFLLLQIFNQRIFHPQLPKPPLAYHEEALALAMQTDDAMLKASLWNAFGTYHIDIEPNIQLAQQGISNALQHLSTTQETEIPRSRVATNLALLETGQGLFHEAVAHLKDAIQIFQKYDFERSKGNALINLSLNLSYLGEYHQARASIEQSIKIAEEIDNTEQNFTASVRYIHILTQSAPLLDRPDEQIAQAQIQAQRIEDNGRSDRTSELMLLRHNNIEVLLTQGHYEQAFIQLEKLLAHIHKNNIRDGGQSDLVIGICSILQARWEDAEKQLKEVLQQARKDHNQALQFFTQCWLVFVAQGLEQHQRAHNLLQEAQHLKRINYPIDDAIYHMTHSALLLHHAKQENTKEAWDEGLKTLAMALHPLPGHRYTAIHCNLDLRLIFRNLLATLPQDKLTTLWAYALDPNSQCLVIGPQALHFRPPGKPWVDLHARPILARLLLLLVQHPEGLSTQDLIDHLYPDEVVLYESGVNRIHKSLSLLRKEGLKPWIKQRKRRYIIAPEAQPVFAPPQNAWWEK